MKAYEDNTIEVTNKKEDFFLKSKLSENERE